MKQGINLIKQDRDFKRLVRGKSLSSVHIRVRWMEKPGQNLPRFGFIVSKKTLPKVVDRNKLKRRMKAITLKHQKEFSPADMIFFPKASALKLSFKRLEQEMLELIRSARLCK